MSRFMYWVSAMSRGQRYSIRQSTEMTFSKNMYQFFVNCYRSWGSINSIDCSVKLTGISRHLNRQIGSTQSILCLLNARARSLRSCSNDTIVHELTDRINSINYVTRYCKGTIVTIVFNPYDRTWIDRSGQLNQLCDSSMHGHDRYDRVRSIRSYLNRQIGSTQSILYHIYARNDRYDRVQ